MGFISTNRSPSPTRHEIFNSHSRVPHFPEPLRPKRSAGVLACGFARRLAGCSYWRRDAATTRSRDGLRYPAHGKGGQSRHFGNRQSAIGNGFSLVEVLVVISLLSFIVLALMAVFSSTQKAFRAAVTQTDILEGSRAAVELITSDLRTMAPSGGVSNFANFGPVNFFVLANSYIPLAQNLPGGGTVQRTNLLNYFFVLGRENTKWTGTGYIVDSASATPLYPLYRFYAETNIASSPWLLYDRFATAINNAQWTNMSHIMDGVVHLTVRAQDPGGRWINNFYPPYVHALNTQFISPSTTPPGLNGYSEAQFYMYGNTVPASVELELGVMEANTLARAESLPNTLPALPPGDRRTSFLQQQAGKVHLFRQRVTIPNVDPAAYQ